jgi:exodeoxyribonuclease VII large subunit
VEQLSRNTIRWGADAAESSFREVVAQGPQKTLGRGFAVVRSAEGGVITSAASAGEADGICVQFQDGTIDASVIRGRRNHG